MEGTRELAKEPKAVPPETAMPSDKGNNKNKGRKSAIAKVPSNTQRCVFLEMQPGRNAQMPPRMKVISHSAGR